MLKTADLPERRRAWLHFALSAHGAPWLVGLGCVLVLAAAHTMQAFGMAPCDLCLKQREPYWAAIPLAAAAGLSGIWRGAPRLAAPILMTLAAATLLYGAGRAVEHVGVIAHWWTSTCSAAKNVSIDDVMSGAVATPIVACDKAPIFLGITLPAYNLLAALALAAIAASVPARMFLNRKPTDER
jgi:disulfide bond formation protein DsbB